MSTDDDDDAFPRSMRHRQVLDVAEEHPDASIDEIASMVPSATADLVENVFDEHGDPAADEAGKAEPEDAEEGSAELPQERENTNHDTTASADEAANPESGEPAEVTLEALSERQRELLEVVAARPDATQDEIADHFHVTPATVSRWASDIEGFEWSDRAEVVARAFETPSTAVSTDGGATTATGGNESDAPDDAVEDLEGRLDRLESRLADLESTGSADDDGIDVELAHKLAHACLQSEAISENEELRILEWLLE
jgi:hypothetical protein